MASVVLTEVWLSDAADLADHTTTDGFGSQGNDLAAAGDVRTYAGGRRRVIRRAGRTRSMPLTLPAVSDATLAWLEDHIGRTVLVRDPKGRRFWGVYFDVSVPDRPGGTPPDVSITLQSVTYSEAVA